MPTKVTISLPEDAAKRLLEKWNARDPALLKEFEQFGGIIDIKPTEPKDQNEQTKPASEVSAED